MGFQLEDRDSDIYHNGAVMTKRLGLATLILAAYTLIAIAFGSFADSRDTEEIRESNKHGKREETDKKEVKETKDITAAEIEEFLKGKELPDTCTKRHEKAEESRRKIEKVFSELLSQQAVVGEEERYQIMKRLLEVCKEDIEQLPPLERKLLEEQMNRLGK